MNSARSLPNPTGRLSEMRRARWFKWMLLAAVLCTVGLYTAEFSHHHDTSAAELRCPICQVMAHSALDVFAPQFKPLPPPIRVRYLALRLTVHTAPRRVLIFTHQSRAPPFV